MRCYPRQASVRLVGFNVRVNESIGIVLQSRIGTELQRKLFLIPTHLLRITQSKRVGCLGLVSSKSDQSFNTKWLDEIIGQNFVQPLRIEPLIRFWRGLRKMQKPIPAGKSKSKWKYWNRPQIENRDGASEKTFSYV
ncbi:unnamed protein product [Nesidiocoris tenuis]|uniref:Uncharacterized protein n=1 Tax=Nesidiocoris tenuis TaxID=355587 RepID=A0A6H5HCY0_9HEMI|nr:unnamed protein product [Nesidiocoris tenuis]